MFRLWLGYGLKVADFVELYGAVLKPHDDCDTGDPLRLRH
jgi:hypothetical protein